jgi:drug/metabolite transporter (DMT)-like permease
LALASAFLLSNLALQHGAARLRASTTALVMLSEIVFATLSSVLLGGAVLDARTVWGGAMILAAACWAALAEGKASH